MLKNNLKRNLLNTTTFYNNCIANVIKLSKESVKNKNEITKPRKLESLSRLDYYGIAYITDIHLEHKIQRNFTKPVSKQKIIDYIESLVKNIAHEVNFHKFPILLIGGDVAAAYELSEIFYTFLNENLKGARVFVVLGNHEYWDCNSDITSHEMKYKELFSRLTETELEKEVRGIFGNLYQAKFGIEIHLLINEILYLEYGTDSYSIMAEDEFNNIDDESLRKKICMSRLTILGGNGFSGYNNEFNATNGIYRDTITTLDNDLELTVRFEAMYSRCKKVVSDKKLIVFTHTPKTNWSKDEYCSNWIYVNGHTHRNRYSLNDNEQIYSDNQIGYYSMQLGLKHFYLSKMFDVFNLYEDCIYVVDKRQYRDFNTYRGNDINFNRENIKIHMLNKHGYYCFIGENTDNGKIYIMNGGQVKLIPQKDLYYYYENMEIYANLVEKIMEKYYSALQQISEEVKSFGGDGTIHGAIVDIDFCNHIYLNPLDGTITPYFANSMTDKYVYENVPSLLRYKCRRLFNKLQKQESTINAESQLIKSNYKLSNAAIHVTDTEIYKFSRVACNLQYITVQKIIRSWSEELVKNKDNLDFATVEKLLA